VTTSEAPQSKLQGKTTARTSSVPHRTRGVGGSNFSITGDTETPGYPLLTRFPLCSSVPPVARFENPGTSSVALGPDQATVPSKVLN
jgi:hypothetical protein